MSLQQQNHGVCGANDMCLLMFDDDDGENITIDENKDEVDNSIERKTKKIGLLNKWKSNHRRSTSSIIRTDHPSSGAAKMSSSLPTINESRNDVEEEGLIMIPDDMSETSFTVLKRYMGCSPIPYLTRRSMLVTTRDRDDSDIRVCAPFNEMVKEDVKSSQQLPPPLTQTRDDKEDDNTSDKSLLDVLMRYISCNPSSHCDYKQHSTTTATSDQVDEISRNDISTNLSHIYRSCEIDDDNSLLSDHDDDEEESIDDVTPEQRHELLIQVIKEMIAGSNDHAERNVDTSTRREEEACQKIERDTADDDQKEEDTEMKSVQRMSSPRKILFKRLLAKRLHNGKGKKQTNKC